MKSNKKKIIFTIIDIAVVIIAGLWVMWLCIYYAVTQPGSSIILRGKYYIFERNYLVPAQIFGITIALTIFTIIMYRKYRKNKLIGKKYIILALFNTIPFWFMSIIQIISMVYFYGILKN